MTREEEVSDQDSRGPLAQNGSVEDRGSFHKSFGMNFMHTWGILKNFCSANFPKSCHSPHQDSRGPPAQDGSLEDPWSFLGVR